MYVFIFWLRFTHPLSSLRMSRRVAVTAATADRKWLPCCGRRRRPTSAAVADASFPDKSSRRVNRSLVTATSSYRNSDFSDFLRCRPSLRTTATDPPATAEIPRRHSINSTTTTLPMKVSTGATVKQNQMKWKSAQRDANTARWL